MARQSLVDVACCISLTIIFFLLIAQPSQAADLATLLKSNYVKVEKVNDLDDITVSINQQRVTVRLASVIAISDLPVKEGLRLPRFRKETLDAVKSLLLDHEFFMRIRKNPEDDRVTAVDLYRTGKHVTKQMPWTGKLPSEKVGWGMTSMNILLIEKGLTISSGKEHGNQLERIKLLYKDAENLAAKENIGVWGNLPRGFREVTKQ
ncbi:MAG: hypothetical protein COA78_08695 [Blastopirellula sp.]|nr:MAG: hypothetical protein COA78_08695 [Blastopirellula sp.]